MFNRGKIMTIFHLAIRRFKSFVISALAIVALVSSACALALDLQIAKQQGLVGETESGYLAVVTGGAEAKQLVADINAQRRAEYERIAKQNGISVASVEALAGKKAIEKTPAGMLVNVGGQWQKK